MSYLGTDAAGVKRWRCDNEACGKTSAWTDAWVSFGSLRDADDLGNEIPVFCSQVCGEATGLRADPEPAKRPKRGEAKDPLAKLSKGRLIALLKAVQSKAAP